MDVSSLVELKGNKRIPDITPGDTVKVHCRIVEGDRERIQVFQGVVIKIRKGGAGTSFTVRHVASGIGVERTFPFYSSNVEKVEIVRQGKVRRSRLYYLRSLSGKEARRKIKRVERKSRVVPEELIAAPEEELQPKDVLTEETVVEETPVTEAPVVEEAVTGEAPAAEEKAEPAAVEPAAVEEKAEPAVEAAELPSAEEPAEKKEEA